MGDELCAYDENDDGGNWILDHAERRRGYKPQKGREFRKELRHEWKALTG